MIEDIVIRDKKDLEQKKQKIAEGGRDKLHVVSDFDRTLTKAYVDGKKIPSLISILRDENYLTADYPGKAHALFNRYHPIEIDPEISMSEKKKMMHEWWTCHFRLLIESGLNKKDIEQAIRSTNIQLREGADDFLKFLNRKNIPLVILSSNGLGGDSIRMYLKNHDLLFGNIHVISNSFKWDKDGRAIGIEEPIIHSLNKSEASVKNYPVFKMLEDRKNVILLGDGVGDTQMVQGFRAGNVIKIGFLNYDIEENLNRFKEAFDVVLPGDQSFDFVNGLLGGIA